MRKNIFIIIIATVLSFFLTLSSLAGDVTVAPTFMPGFPMLAGDDVMIMWVPVPGAVKYRIYQNGKYIRNRIWIADIDYPEGECK